MARRVSDEAAREDALDPQQSWIVQAPAGSGKTELLIQRYLTLLGTVELPEQIVAITFTRKAAAEMRNRIIEALTEAATGRPPPAPHRVRTLQLATAVLERDGRLGWQLLEQSHRLRIDTVDALNVWLAQQLPMLAGGVAGAQLADDASRYYRLAAARSCDGLERRDGRGSDVWLLLERLDNNVPVLERLLADMLPRRDQWLRHVVGNDERTLRAELEGGLARLVRDTLGALQRALSTTRLHAIAALARHAAAQAASVRVRRELEPWLVGDGAPDFGADALPLWQGAARLLLTRSGQWRRRFTKDFGFGAGHPEMRAQAHRLMHALGHDELLRRRLQATLELPGTEYDAGEWAVLNALRTVLTQAAAELRVLFAEDNTVDFVELAFAAQQALGEVDDPSELLLALDRRILHLLVDEFQDTSHGQLRLIELLTAGWQPGDGRSLFIVGDPMQSIYRFRDADMSLFLKVKRDGVGQLDCRQLKLQQNFRSSPRIVEWVNAVFPRLFPAEDDVGGGAARFYPCTATRAGTDDDAVHIDALRDEDPLAEIRRVIEILDAEGRRGPQRSIAILVQSRSHLMGLHAQLRADGWPVHAVELEALSQQPLGQDLLGLTRALTHHGDRIAWLAVLRAPWCGLTWGDLHTLCDGHEDRTIWSLLNEPEVVARLGEPGQRRLAQTRDVLRCALTARANQSLARWIERTWISLGGPACLDGIDELRLAESFFATLERATRRGDVDDPAALEGVFSRAQGVGDSARETGIEIMTVHRAKGLEFDTVIVLGLGREPRPEPAKALYWMQRANAAGRHDLLLSPLTAVSGDASPLTRYLQRTERAHQHAERCRLLYVACTRARHRLHLIGQLRPGAEPPSRSLLALLWPKLRERAGAAVAGSEHARPARAAPVRPLLRRLADTPGPLPTQAPPAGAPALRPVFEWAGHTAVQVGNLVHEHLQRIANEGLRAWSPERVEARRDSIRCSLELLGVERRESAAAAGRVVEALSEALASADGRWILGAHDEAESELRLTLRTEHGLEHLRVDRTFVADGQRWIIDFKTSTHEGAGIDAFLDAEVERYSAQLERYARAMAGTERRPQRLGLYFPMLRAFRSWAPDSATSSLPG